MGPEILADLCWVGALGLALAFALRKLGAGKEAKKDSHGMPHEDGEARQNMIYPQELSFRKTHEWLRMREDGIAEIGISDYAQDAIGEVIFVNLPRIGDTVTGGKTFGYINCKKAFYKTVSPVSGKISEVNDALLGAPKEVNEDPYGAWLIRVKDVVDMEDTLMDADSYKALCESEKAAG